MIAININNLYELMRYIEDYKSRYENTYTSLDYIENRIKSIYKKQGICDEYQIPVCSDWENKVYCFETSTAIETDNFVLILVTFTGIKKG